MWRALCLLLCVGCANPTRMEQKPHLDFGLEEERPDLSEPPDLAVLTDVDMATTPSSDLASADLQKTADLLPPPSCDDAGTTGHLFLAAAGNANALVTSRFDGSSWTAYQSLSNATDVAETIVAARPYVVVRQTNAALTATAADPCTQAFATLAPINAATTAMRPALLPDDLVFRGNFDNNLYYMTRTASAWQAPTKQDNLTTSMPFALVQFDGARRVYYNESGKLTEGLVSSTAGGGTKAQVLSESVGQPPTAVVDGSGNLHVVYVAPDTNLNWVWRAPGGSFTHHTLCEGQSGCLIDTNLPISLALDSSGTPIVAWVGISGHQVYTAKLLSTAGPQFWSAPTAASGSCNFGDNRDKDCQTTVGPALATGIGGMSAELVFVSDLDGRARHARLSGSSWGQPVSLVGTNLLNTPALIAEP